MRNGLYGVQRQQESCRIFAFQPGLPVVRREANPATGNATNRSSRVQRTQESSSCRLDDVWTQRSGNQAVSEGADSDSTLFGKGGEISQAEIDFATSRGIWVRQAMRSA